MKKLKTIYLTALAASVMLFAFTPKTAKTLEQVFAQKWTTKSYSEPKIQVETPKELVKANVSIPEKTKESVEKMSAYQYDEDDLMIIVSTLAYKKGTAANLKGAAAGALYEMQTRGGIDEFSYVNKDTVVSGINSILQRGTFKKGNDKIDFNNLITAKENNIWQVMVAYRSGDVYGGKIRDKVMKSVKIQQ